MSRWHDREIINMFPIFKNLLFQASTNVSRLISHQNNAQILKNRYFDYYHFTCHDREILKFKIHKFCDFTNNNQKATLQMRKLALLAIKVVIVNKILQLNSEAAKILVNKEKIIHSKKNTGHCLNTS